VIGFEGTPAIEQRGDFQPYTLAFAFTIPDVTYPGWSAEILTPEACSMLTHPGIFPHQWCARIST